MKKILFFLIANLVLLFGCAVNPNIDSTDSLQDIEGTVVNVADINEPTATLPDTNAALSYSEQEITVNPGEWELPGTLTLPEGEGPFPAVVFSHAMGMSDRDGGPGNQKLYRDLAEYLAEQGIASIRYDQRNFVYFSQMFSDINATDKEKVIDDAFHAVKLAKTVDNINPDMIFVAGWSYGGYLIPKIDQEDTDDMIAGYMVMASPFCSREELLEPVYGPEAAKQIKNLTEADRGSNQMIDAHYPTYWLYVADYNPFELVKNVEEPILFLQGGHDERCQGLLPAFFERLRTELAGNDNAIFKFYPDLSHTFVKTEKICTLEDYNIEAKAEKEVAIDIAEFIMNQYN